MMNNPPRRLDVKLYEQQGKTSVVIYAEIDDKGDLVISGQDTGEAPLQIWGDLDYEYWLTVTSENKEIILQALTELCKQTGVVTPSKFRNKDKALLALLKHLYGGHSTAFGDIRSFLEEKGIPAEFTNYI